MRSTKLQRIRVGDGRICPLENRHQSKTGRRSRSMEPDIVMCSSDNYARIVGELKTCWTITDLTEGIVDFRAEPTCALGHALGQVLLYMEAFGCRYGFLSTYKETMVLKLGEHPTRGGPALFHSPAILSSGFHRLSEHAPNDASVVKNPRNAGINAKQAMLYLMLRATEMPPTGILKEFPQAVANLLGFDPSVSGSGAGTTHASTPPKNQSNSKAPRRNSPASGGQQERHLPISGAQQASRVLVPPEAAWPLKSGGLLSSKVKILVPNKGWKEIEGARLQRDSRNRPFFQSSGFTENQPGLIYVRAAG